MHDNLLTGSSSDSVFFHRNFPIHFTAHSLTVHSLKPQWTMITSISSLQCAKSSWDEGAGLTVARAELKPNMRKHTDVPLVPWFPSGESHVKTSQWFEPKCPFTPKHNTTEPEKPLHNKSPLGEDYTWFIMNFRLYESLHSSDWSSIW